MTIYARRWLRRDRLHVHNFFSAFKHLIVSFLVGRLEPINCISIHLNGERLFETGAFEERISITLEGKK